MNLRWLIKRCLKWGVQWGMTISGAGLLYRRSDLFNTGYRILAYHAITDRPTDSYTVSTNHFKQHMKYLADNHQVVSLDDMVGRMRSGILPEHGTVAVTFDDGYKEIAGDVAEILNSFKIPATFFVVTGFIDSGNRRYANWDEIRDLSRSGFGIGSHTVSHLSLPSLGEADMTYELEHSGLRIFEEIGKHPSALAYPYGTWRDFSPVVGRASQTAGYKYAVTAVNGLNHLNSDAFLLKRTSLMAGDGPWSFKRIMNGNLDAWYFADRLGYRFQRVYDA